MLTHTNERVIIIEDVSVVIKPDIHNSLVVGVDLVLPHSPIGSVTWSLSVCSMGARHIVHLPTKQPHLQDDHGRHLVKCGVI